MTVHTRGEPYGSTGGEMCIYGDVEDCYDVIYSVPQEPVDPPDGGEAGTVTTAESQDSGGNDGSAETEITGNGNGFFDFFSDAGFIGIAVALAVVAALMFALD